MLLVAVIFVHLLFGPRAAVAQCNCITEQCLACAECGDPNAHVFPPGASACTDVPVFGEPCPSDWVNGIPDGRKAGADDVEVDFIKCHLSMRRCPHLHIGAGCAFDNRRGALFPYGIDASLLSSTDIAELAGLPAQVGATLASYASHRGQAASLAMCECPGAAVSDDDAKRLFDSMFTLVFDRVRARYAAERGPSTVAWSGIQRCFRTAIVAVFWDRELPGGAPKVWEAALANNWFGLIGEMYSLASGCPDDTCRARLQAMGRMLEVCRRGCTADLMFLQDDTVSVDNQEYEMCRQAIYNIADGFGDLSSTGVRMGLEAYALFDDNDWWGRNANAKRQHKHFSLTKYTTKQQYLSSLAAHRRISIPGTVSGCCKTFTAYAVIKARNSLLAQARPLSENVPRVHLLLTDGLSHVEPEAQRRFSSWQAYDKYAYQQLLLHNITSFAMGVMDMRWIRDPVAHASTISRMKQEIALYAGAPERGYVASFDVLESMAEQVAGQVCLAHAVATDGTLGINPGETRYLATNLSWTCTGSAHRLFKFEMLTGKVDFYGSHTHAEKNPNPGSYGVHETGEAGQTVLITLSGQPHTRAYMAIRSSASSLSSVRMTVTDCCGDDCYPPTPTPPITPTATRVVTQTVPPTATTTRQLDLRWRREPRVGAAAAADGAATVTFLGPVFGPGNVFMLSRTENCADGALGAVSEPWAWTAGADQEDDLAVPFIVLEPVRRVFACRSTDSGATWAAVPAVATSQPFFEVWPHRPLWTALTPPDPTQSAKLRVALRNVQLDGLQAVLTSDRFGCMHDPPSPALAAADAKEELILKGARSVIVSFPAVGHPEDAVYVCVRQDAAGTWTMAVEEPLPGEPSARDHFPVLKEDSQARKVVLSCNDALAGAPLRCVVCIETTVGGRTLCVNPLAEACEVSDMIDGNGVRACPLPTLVAFNGTHADLTYVPQAVGNAGRIVVSCNGEVVPAIETRQQAELLAALALMSGTEGGVGTTCAGLAPGDAGGGSLFAVENAGARKGVATAAALMDRDTAAFAARPATVAQRTIAEVPAVELAAGVPADGAAHEVAATRALPGGTAVCRLGVLVHLDGPVAAGASAVVGEADRRVAEVQLVGDDGTEVAGFDIDAAPAGGGRVTKRVLGAAGAQTTTLDLRTWDKLGGFAGLPRGVTSVTLTVRWSTGAPFRLGWRAALAEPFLKCEGSVTPFTPPGELAALEALADAVLPGDRAATAGWGVRQTDPCVRFWRGVECRHGHVVGIRLDGAPTEGEVPSLAGLPFLETLVMRRGGLTGTLGLQLELNRNVKLIDVSDNNLTAMYFPLGRLRCLRRVLAPYNQLAAWPGNAERLWRVEHLALQRNQMAGGVPALHAVGTLKAIDVSCNTLSGALPTLPEMTALAMFNSNRFEGGAPPQWAGLRVAHRIDVSGNALGYASAETFRMMPAAAPERRLEPHRGASAQLGRAHGRRARQRVGLPAAGLRRPLGHPRQDVLRASLQWNRRLIVCAGALMACWHRVTQPGDL